MCIFGGSRAPAPPPPVPPAPLPPPPPPMPEPLPEVKAKPVNPTVKPAMTKLGTKKGQKGSTGDLRIDKNPAQQGLNKSLNTGNTTKGINP